MDKSNCSGQGPIEDPYKIDKVSRGSLPHTRHIFCEQIPFFLVLSRKIYFTEVNHLANFTFLDLYKSSKEVSHYYLQRGFCITKVHIYGEFGPLKILIESLPGVALVNITASNEHFPDIKRQIRVVKERWRATRHGLPLKCMMKLLTNHIGLQMVKKLNSFPMKGRISDSLAPNTIMSGDTLDFKKHLRLQLGRYCQLHEYKIPRNSQSTRTKEVICLGSSGNIQGR